MKRVIKGDMEQEVKNCVRREWPAMLDVCGCGECDELRGFEILGLSPHEIRGLLLDARRLLAALGGKEWGQLSDHRLAGATESVSSEGVLTNHRATCTHGPLHSCAVLGVQ
jgi:hypothetical protein